MLGQDREFASMRERRDALRQIAVEKFNQHPSDPDRASAEASKEIHVKFGGILASIAPSLAIKFVVHLIAIWAVNKLTVAPSDCGEPIEIEDAS